MICTNVYLADEVKKLLIKAAAIKGISIEALASEIINEAVQKQFGVILENGVSKLRSKPALAATEPFFFYGTAEESGIPVDEWEMENDYS
ncbi:hypothetical protein VB711_06585 [Cronbergia sp. UHCC 0137]|uniref:hypothetical protein n=1 Tax=Cronbergia sp. UHCC 0137 TaxID=3110239 RepID=UPI002B214FAD|nr:hypothetical protein [Cronbergia sp. UHCC 0137]MEA5617504.1 hypothetical protein [Cronbergia sp. UHCC 0137]